MLDGGRLAATAAVALLLAVAGRRPVAGQRQPRNATSSSSFSAGGSPALDHSTAAAAAATDAAIDVQYASCKIVTDRIVATAEGKFSRFCHGICNTNETNARLNRIETLLMADGEYIKRRLFNLERIFSDGSVKTLRESAADGGDTGRLREVAAYNGTVSAAADGDAAAFVYYWRVDAFWRLTFADGLARSRPFYVSPGGYRVALTVRSDAAARTVRVAAVSAAGEYDAQLRWPFAHRLRVSVLDQTDVAPEDIVSRIWDSVRCAPPAAAPPQQRRERQLQQQQQHQQQPDVCAHVEFRHDVLTYRRYVADDALLVKLTVFLRR